MRWLKKTGDEKRDIKATAGKKCFSQHRLLVLDLAWENNPIEKKKELEKIKLCRLKIKGSSKKLNKRDHNHNKKL